MFALSCSPGIRARWNLAPVKEEFVVRLREVLKRSAATHFKRALAHLTRKLFNGRLRGAEGHRAIDVAGQGRIRGNFQPPVSDVDVTVKQTACPRFQKRRDCLKEAPPSAGLWETAASRRRFQSSEFANLAESPPSGSIQRSLPSAALTTPNGLSTFNVAGESPGEANSPANDAMPSAPLNRRVQLERRTRPVLKPSSSIHVLQFSRRSGESAATPPR